MCYIITYLSQPENVQVENVSHLHANSSYHLATILFVSYKIKLLLPGYYCWFCYDQDMFLSFI